MQLRVKAGLIQAAVAAVIIPLLIQPAFILGYTSYVWLLFMALPLFFLLGADLRALPSMLLSFAAGQLWAVLLGVATGALAGLLGPAAGGALAAVLVIFTMLTVHDTLLKSTFLGNVPAMFTGMALTSFVLDLTPAEAPALTPLHITAFFLYGTVIAVALAMVGGFLCSRVLGEDWRTKLEGGSAEEAPAV
ncbi:DUF1097 family protein [Thermobifida halotolerans]|uniref:DUF1097 family protein n=1 Tax=Thermobifida halotolerans TaxID=483545 RepID=A0A399G4G6_9ACTN|nr:DUF1097 family protein [Thermobifida halotolerans]UOE20336.1 DUF1097 family protein [Thermobifida halotolerans]